MQVQRPTELLERTLPLARFAAALEGLQTRPSQGACLLISGEAGIGKTSLLRQSRQLAPVGLQWLHGACEPWPLPLPMGPLIDFADALPPSLAHAVRSGAPLRDVLGGLLELVRDTRRTTVLVIDDVQWADTATLDVLRFVARRLDGTRTLLVLAYRDDAIAADHPLRGVLGSIPREKIQRIELQPLTRTAVEGWAQRSGHSDPAEVWRVTGGNPFYVAEMLTCDPGQLPTTVRDTVLARAARLPAAWREVLDWVCIEPVCLELQVLAAVQPTLANALVPGVADDLLKFDEQGVSFRHDLARQALLTALLPARRRQLHGALLQALDGFAATAARRVHHALQAGRDDDVARWTPRAAAEAAQAGEHRQAAALYSQALVDGTHLDRALWLEARAHARLLINEHAGAIADRHAALALAQQRADIDGIARNQAWLGRLHWMRDGDLHLAVPWVDAAIHGLEAQPPGPVLAQACSARAHLALVAKDLASTQEWGERAVQAARAQGDDQALACSLNTLGTARVLAGALETGLDQLQQSLDIATRRHFHEDVARARLNLFVVLVVARRFDAGLLHADVGVAYSEQHGLDVFTVRLRVRRALALLMVGQWTQAQADLTEIAQHHTPAPREAAACDFVAALLALRRGERGARAWLTRAVDQMHQHQVELWFMHTAAALAEAAWLADDPSAAAAALSSVGPLPDRRRCNELAVWARRCGVDIAVRVGLPLEVATGVATDVATDVATEPEHGVRQAAQGWQALGCPYEQALALMEGDAQDLRQALELLESLGAAAAARLARRRLRELGERTVPRGQYAHARQDPLGLTAREREVLELLAKGLANREVGAALHRSERTVEKHVAALLVKLNARDRHAAVRRLTENQVLRR